MAQTKIANNQLQLDTDSFYTQDNLIAGKSIEIAEYVNPYVIDENTVGLWHFDGSLVDEISGNSITSGDSRGVEYCETEGKFKFTKSLYGINRTSTSGQGYSRQWRFPSTFTFTSGWSVDFWCTCTSEQSGYIQFHCTTYGAQVIQLQVGKVSSQVWSSLISTHNIENLPDGGLHHIAFCSNGSSLYYFIDGSLKNTIDISAHTQVNYNVMNVAQTNQYYANVATVDELRISNVCRWTEDFEVPDAPYEPASGSNPMAINAIVDSSLSSTSKNPVQNKVINTALSGKQAVLTTATGYDATKTQVLKNINGVLTWVDEA